MGTEELDRLIDSLPDIDTYKRPGGRCYAFSYSGEISYSVLLARMLKNLCLERLVRQQASSLVLHLVKQQVEVCLQM